MRKLHSLLALGLAAGFTALAPAQLVINEVGTVEPTTDDQEFVELYDGGALTSLVGIELRLINAGNGTAYTTVDLGAAVATMPADGYLVIGNSTVPNVDIVFVTTTNILQNGDPDAVQLFNTGNATAIDAVSYFTQYDSTPGTAENGLLAANAYEGAGGTGAGGANGADATVGLRHYHQTGTTASAQVADISIGRVFDGVDSNDNFNDINQLFLGRTSGSANSVGYAATATEDFSQATGLSRIWSPAFVDVALQTAATATPAAIPNSPDAVTPTEWASVKDNSGGGDQALIVDVFAQDYTVSGSFYSGAISTLISPETEVGGLFVRANGGIHDNNSKQGYDITSPIGIYGTSYYGLEVDYVAGTVSAINVAKNVRTVLASTNVSVGWNTLAIQCNGSLVQYGVNGVELTALGSETPRSGYVGVGYRETQVVGAGTVRNNFDDLNVTAPVAVPVELSSFVIE